MSEFAIISIVERIKVGDKVKLPGDSEYRTVESVKETIIPGDYEWQPIKTAPKDGKRVLVTDGKEIDLCRFYRDGRMDTYTYAIKPTHWTPLPNIPNEK